MPACYQLLRQHQGQRVLRKRARCVTKDVARELVQHQFLRQPPLGAIATGKQLAARSRFQRRAKAFAQGGDQSGVLDEVLLVGEIFEPEVEDGFHNQISAAP